jgi:hypothetical protein
MLLFQFVLSSVVGFNVDGDISTRSGCFRITIRPFLIPDSSNSQISWIGSVQGNDSGYRADVSFLLLLGPLSWGDYLMLGIYGVH